jgi:hypothetical protein
MGDIEEIIGINNKDILDQSKSPNKTSIMTTSSGKTLKRKHEDDSVIYAEDENPEKRIAHLSDKPEITITLKAKETDVV